MYYPFALAAAGLLSIATASAQAPLEASHAAPTTVKKVVLFTSLGEATVRPMLVPFEQRHGIAVEVVRVRRPGRDEAAAMLTRCRDAGGDVWWCQETLATDALQRVGALARMSPAPAVAREVPANFHDAGGLWFGFAPRARVLMVNTRLLAAGERPRALQDLLAERLRGKVALTMPHSGTALLHLLALEASGGAGASERFVTGMLANECIVAASDRMLAEMVGDGEVLAGMTDTSDYLSVRQQGKPVDCIYPDQDGGGTLLIPHTVALLATARHAEAGRQLIEYLLSAEVEAMLVAQDKGQLPLRAGVPLPAGVPARVDLRTMNVDFGAAAELLPRLAQPLASRLVAITGVTAQLRPQAPVTINFDTMAVGAAPAGMSIAQTGGGEPCVWQVTADPSSRGGGRVITQLESTANGRRFPMCIYDGLHVRDVAVQAAFKTMTGETDRAAGLCVRYQDADNYYCCRVNSLEDNYRLYKVVDGRRIELAGVDHVQIWEDVWQTMRLEVEGTHFRVWLNGALMFEVDDDTFAQAGRVGLWLKGDSITSMDDLVIAAPSRHRRVVFAKLGDAGPTSGFAIVTSGEQQTEWQLTAATEPVAITPIRIGAASARAGTMLLDEVIEARDVSVSTRFKVATAGSGMHLAGLVARYRSEREHYYLRINLEECNLRLYRVRDGKSVLVGERHHTTFDDHQWHTAQLSAVGAHLELQIDGVVQFAVEDPEPLPAGRAGLWAVPGGDTLFAEVSIEDFGGS